MSPVLPLRAADFSMNQRFVEACQKGQFQNVKHYLSNGISPNQKINGDPLLHWLIDHRDEVENITEIVQALVNAGDNSESFSKIKETALSIAIKIHHIGLIKILNLSNKNPDDLISSKERKGIPISSKIENLKKESAVEDLVTVQRDPQQIAQALSSAIKKGKRREAQFYLMLLKGIKLPSALLWRDLFKLAAPYPLILKDLIAVQSGRFEMEEDLFITIAARKKRYDVLNPMRLIIASKSLSFKRNLFKRALKTRDLRLGRFLVHQCLFKINFPFQRDGVKNSQLVTTYLHEAVSKKDHQQVKFLLDCGADVNVVNMNLETPLHKAVELEDEVTIDLLLNQDNIDLSPKNVDGHRYSEMTQNKDLVFQCLNKKWARMNDKFLNSIKDLKAKGVNVNFLDENGYTILDKIYSDSLWENSTITAVIELGGKFIHPKSLYEAVNKKDLKMVKFMVETCGLSVNSHYILPLRHSLISLSLYNGSDEITHYLLDKGARVSHITTISSLFSTVGIKRDILERLVEKGIPYELEFIEEVAEGMLKGTVKRDIGLIKLLCQKYKAFSLSFCISSSSETLSGLKSLIELLLQENENIDEPLDMHGKTAFHLAVKHSLDVTLNESFRTGNRGAEGTISKELLELIYRKKNEKAVSKMNELLIDSVKKRDFPEKNDKFLSELEAACKDSSDLEKLFNTAQIIFEKNKIKASLYQEIFIELNSEFLSWFFERLKIKSPQLKKLLKIVKAQEGVCPISMVPLAEIFQRGAALVDGNKIYDVEDGDTIYDIHAFTLGVLSTDAESGRMVHPMKRHPLSPKLKMRLQEKYEISDLEWEELGTYSNGHLDEGMSPRLRKFGTHLDKENRTKKTLIELLYYDYANFKGNFSLPFDKEHKGREHKGDSF